MEVYIDDKLVKSKTTSYHIHDLVESFEVLHAHQMKLNPSTKCHEAFDELKQYLASPPLLMSPRDGKELYLYLAVPEVALNSILIRQDSDFQRSFTIQLVNWVIELGEFDIKFQLRLTIKGQALADFIVEITITIVDEHPTKDMGHHLDDRNGFSTWMVCLRI
ncbi:hypothetical protein Nepgr_005154 [Nepenthes gracilis]|uniref:Uncharacterized protein n=1 Tax=Nepenthes gracilis TaxID=150966 RepID=A0AAD3XG28_NEPGR|nr:hypothetical protein Nepgr_005154 [Nepenthes gracilis]